MASKIRARLTHAGAKRPYLIFGGKCLFLPKEQELQIKAQNCIGQKGFLSRNTKLHWTKGVLVTQLLYTYICNLNSRWGRARM